MRDPNNLHNIFEECDSESIIKIDCIPPYDIQDFDLTDEKEFKKYLESIEKDVRTSFEYRELTRYLRENLNMNECSFYKNVNNLDTFRIKIEIHHEPITLFDIVLIVYNKRCFYHESLEEEMVAKEVMYLHYMMMVGLIPLSETVHELVHNQFLFVPTDKVYGNYKKFVQLYQKFMTPEQQEILDRIEEASMMCHEEYKTLLETNYCYVDATGAYDLPPMSEVINMLKERVNKIRDMKTQNIICPIVLDE